MNVGHLVAIVVVVADGDGDGVAVAAVDDAAVVCLLNEVVVFDHDVLLDRNLDICRQTAWANNLIRGTDDLLKGERSLVAYCCIRCYYFLKIHSLRRHFRQNLRD